MRPLSSLGVGLSLVFGCLMLALVAEIYYLFWWRTRRRTAGRDTDVEGVDVAGSPRDLCCFCCVRTKAPPRRSRGPGNPQLYSSAMALMWEVDGHWNRIPHGGGDGGEAELAGLHALAGPSRLLFPIKEETKEDLESEDGKSRGEESGKGSRRRSMGDVLLHSSAETPFFTPLSSPLFFTPPLTPNGCGSPRGLSPLSDHSGEGGGDRKRSGFGSSPPPRFKFLKDAEEKLYRKTLMEEAMRVQRSAAALAGETSSSSAVRSEEEDGSFVALVIGRNQDRGRHQHHPSTSQVTPLPSEVREPAPEETHSPQGG